MKGRNLSHNQKTPEKMVAVMNETVCKLPSTVTERKQ